MLSELLVKDGGPGYDLTEDYLDKRTNENDIEIRNKIFGFETLELSPKLCLKKILAGGLSPKK